MLLLLLLLLLLLSLAYTGLHNDLYPVYASRRFSLKEMVEICIGEKVETKNVCKVVPQHVYYDSAFVVDLHAVSAIDLTTDGLIYHSHTCPKKHVDVEYVLTKLIQAKIVPTSSKATFVMHRQYSHCSSSQIPGVYLKRTITRFSKGTDKKCRYAIITYKSNYSDISGEAIPTTDIYKKIHGNSKLRKEKYTRTFPSVMKDIKVHGLTTTPKRVISLLQKKAGGVYTMKSPSEVARDRTQVYNAIRNVDRPKSRNTGNFFITNVKCARHMFIKNIVCDHGLTDIFGQ